MKELNKATRDEQLKRDIAENFKKVCYSPSRRVANDSLNRISTHHLGINEYIASSIEPYLNKFARSYIDNFTRGYNTTSAGESINLIKSDMSASNYTLLEMKKIIIRKFDRKEIIREETYFLHNQKEGILENRFGVRVRSNIKEKLTASLLKSTRLMEVASEDGDDPDFTTYYDPEDPDKALYKTNEFQYSCLKLKFSGMPCSHLIRKNIDRNKNPFLLLRKYIIHAF